jgi:hypothetical protein
MEREFKKNKTIEKIERKKKFFRRLWELFNAIARNREAQSIPIGLAKDPINAKRSKFRGRQFL